MCSIVFLDTIVKGLEALPSPVIYVPHFAIPVSHRSVGLLDPSRPQILSNLTIDNSLDVIMFLNTIKLISKQTCTQFTNLFPPKVTGE